MPTPITRDGLKARIDSGDAVVVEALTRDDYESSHLPGAVFLELSEVSEKAPELIGDKQRPVVTYCGGVTCRSSTRMAEALERLGYKNVYEYQEGKPDWQEAGLPLETEVSA